MKMTDPREGSDGFWRDCTVDIADDPEGGERKQKDRCEWCNVRKVME